MNTEREKFEKFAKRKKYTLIAATAEGKHEYLNQKTHTAWEAWQAAKADAVPTQFNVNSILRDIDFYFDNGLSNTERTACNLLQSIYEKLSNEAKAMSEAQEQSE